MHSIERATLLFHLKIEDIHPFVDGNGRTEHLILNLMLMQAEYRPVNVKFSYWKCYCDEFNVFIKSDNHDEIINIILSGIKHKLASLLYFSQ